MVKYIVNVTNTIPPEKTSETWFGLNGYYFPHIVLNPNRKKIFERLWKSHEVGHLTYNLSRFKDEESARADWTNDEESYPRNKMEKFAFQIQFKYLKKNGITWEEVERGLSEEYTSTSGLQEYINDKKQYFENMWIHCDDELKKLNFGSKEGQLFNEIMNNLKYVNEFGNTEEDKKYVKEFYPLFENRHNTLVETVQDFIG